MIKTGIVMCITNKKAGIMTTSGEFVYIKTSNVLPNIGEVHTGELYKKTLFNYKYFITAASLMFILISSASAYAYYTPVTTIVLNINPSVSLKANRWNKIISFKALNSEGSLILNNIKLKNKSIDTGLELIVKEAKTENFINDKYVTDKKIISVDIISNLENSIDISNFKNIIDSNYLNIKINASSGNNTNIDITINNKKIDISNLNNPNSSKKESINKNSNTKINPLKKPSVNINSNKVENKSSEIKKESKNSDKTIKSEDNKINKDGESENKNSSFIKRLITPNGIKNNLQDEKNKNTQNVKMTNSSDKNSDNYENPQKNR
ncbi:MAG TPA: hypothetical protein VIK86_03670 [Candidatus Paceibacterota bacterium]